MCVVLKEKGGGSMSLARELKVVTQPAVWSMLHFDNNVNVDLFKHKDIYIYKLCLTSL